MNRDKFMHCWFKRCVLMSDIRTKKREYITLAYLQLSGFTQGLLKVLIDHNRY